MLSCIGTNKYFTGVNDYAYKRCRYLVVKGCRVGNKSLPTIPCKRPSTLSKLENEICLYF